jgi:uncharacterized membrane protein
VKAAQRLRPPKVRSSPLWTGLGLLAAEILGLLALAWLHPSTAGALLAAIGANHLGGRLAFIGVGLESGFNPYILILVIIVYNTTYVLLMYSLFVLFSDRLKTLRFFRKQMENLARQAKRRRRFLNRWNRLAIFWFVWIPLPWTGAAIGSYIAHMEGYSSRENLAVVLPAMWVGVASWTLWFDRLYRYVEGFGKNRTMILTVGFLLLPVLVVLFDLLRGRQRAGSGDQTRDER